MLNFVVLSTGQVVLKNYHECLQNFCGNALYLHPDYISKNQKHECLKMED